MKKNHFLFLTKLVIYHYLYNKTLIFILIRNEHFLYYIHRHRSILSLAYQCTELDKLHLPASQMLQIERMEGEKKKKRKLENKMPTLGN